MVVWRSHTNINERRLKVYGKNVQILLQMRKEKLEQINKLEQEYQAIGEIITKLYEYEQDKIDREEEERWMI